MELKFRHRTFFVSRSFFSKDSFCLSILFTLSTSNFLKSKDNWFLYPLSHYSPILLYFEEEEKNSAAFVKRLWRRALTEAGPELALHNVDSFLVGCVREEFSANFSSRFRADSGRLIVFVLCLSVHPWLYSSRRPISCEKSSIFPPHYAIGSNSTGPQSSIYGFRSAFQRRCDVNRSNR